MENIWQNPVVFKIHNGTVRSDANLCRNCRNAHRTVGASTGREHIVCNANYSKPVTLREPIASCTAHSDRSQPTLQDMHDIAWTLMTDKGGRKIGFQSPEQREGRQSPGGPVGF